MKDPRLFPSLEIPMSNSLDLLALPHHPQAARQILAEALKPGIDPNKLLLGEELVGTGNKMILPVYVDGSAFVDPNWKFHGTVDMTYKRLDLQDSLGHLNLELAVGAMYTSRELATRIGAILKINFDDADYVHETKVMNGLSEIYVLKAEENSPRWMGQVSIRVFR